MYSIQERVQTTDQASHWRRAERQVLDRLEHTLNCLLAMRDQRLAECRREPALQAIPIDNGRRAVRPQSRIYDPDVADWL
jgi:hypothetical protein